MTIEVLSEFVLDFLSSYLKEKKDYYLADIEDLFRERIAEEKNNGHSFPENLPEEKFRKKLSEKLVKQHENEKTKEFIEIALRKISYIIKTLDRKSFSSETRAINNKFVYPTEENLKYTRAYQVSEGKYPDLKHNYTMELLKY